MKDISELKKNIQEHKILAVIVLTVTVVYSYLSIFRHNNFQSHAYDLGLYDQVVWLYSTFQTPFSTIRNMILLGDHFHPILILFAPLYWIWADVKVLLLVQVILVVFSVIPIYAISEDKFKKRYISILISLSYLFFIGLQNALEFDFHMATISVFFLSWLLYYYYSENQKCFWVFLVLTLMVKEDMALVVFMLGLYDIFFKKNLKRGMLISSLSLGLFLVYFKLISPALNPTSGDYLILVFPGNSLLEQVKYVFFNPIDSFNLIVNPEIKREAFKILYAPFLFLPLLSPFSVLLGLPLLAERFLSVFPFRWVTGFHYSANITPILIIGSIFGIDNLYKIMSKKLTVSKDRFVSFFVLMFLVSAVFLTFSEKTMLSWLWNKDFDKNNSLRTDMNNILQEIPSNVSVSSQSALVPHLSQRKEIYMYPQNISESEYVIISKDIETYPFSYNEMDEQIKKMNNDSRFVLIDQVRKTYLFQDKGKPIQ